MKSLFHEGREPIARESWDRASVVVGGTSVTAEPQGTLSFHSDTPFDTLFISSGNAPCFAIDNLALNETLPEPVGLILAAVGLGGMTLEAWRRRR
jgi:hypothetical protein